MQRVTVLALAVAATLGAAQAAPTISAKHAAALKAADAEFSKERYDEAIVAYNKLKRMVASDADKNLLAVRVARVHLARGRVHRAQFLLGQLRREHPDYVPAMVEYARLNLYHLPDRAGSIEKAERALLEARKVEARNPDVWIEWGHLAMARGRYQDAIERFKKVYEGMDRRAFRAYHGEAKAWVRLSRFDKARAVMRAALDEGPNWGENHWMAGNVELASREGGSETRAVGNYLYAVGLDDAIPRYKGWAIMAQFVAHQYGQAHPIEKALGAQAPDNSYVLAAAGIRQEIAGSIAKARDLYQRAVEADWNNPWSHWLLANVQLGRGNREVVEAATLNPFLYGPFENKLEAARHLAAVERLAPEFPFRKQVAAQKKKAEKHTAGKDSPAFREKLGRLKGYLSKIRSAPPQP